LTGDGPECLLGITWIDPRILPRVEPISLIAMPDDALPSGTSLAHEYKHAAMFYAGEYDPDHTAPDWMNLGDCGPCAYMHPMTCGRCGSVDAANEFLQRHGQ